MPQPPTGVPVATASPHTGIALNGGATHQSAAISAVVREKDLVTNRMVVDMQGDGVSRQGDSNSVWLTPRSTHATAIPSSCDPDDKSMTVLRIDKRQNLMQQNRGRRTKRPSAPSPTGGGTAKRQKAA